MKGQAIKKIKDEMEKNNKDMFVKTIGDFLLREIETKEKVAEAVAADKKTIIGAIKQMESEAKKIAVNNRAGFAYDQGIEIVAKYYGFEYTPQTNIPNQVIEQPRIEDV